MYSPFEPTQNNLLLLKVLQTWAEGGMERAPPAGKPPKPPPASAKVAGRIARRLLLWTAQAMLMWREQRLPRTSPPQLLHRRLLLRTMCSSPSST